MADRVGVAIILLIILFIFVELKAFFILAVIFGIICLIEWLVLAKKTNSGVYLTAFVACFFFLFPVWGFLYLNNYQSAVLVSTVAITDLLAYFVGKNYGRRPLAPTISPNKTLEGFLGAVTISPLIIYSVIFAIGAAIINPLILFIISCLSQCGDLLESKLKRYLLVKDTGYLLRGHGGFMDRFDGFIFAVPFFAIVNYLGWL